MPIRFSTQAANADIMGDDSEAGTAAEGTTKSEGAAARTHERYQRGPERQVPASDSPRGEAKPGKDINAAGFVKDKDASKP